ncbi:MAG: hypothetical protein JXB30_08120, partial [Anaerolineae bacterium]|nr:hypothetical protein [Anaerolineae bacterium]
NTFEMDHRSSLTAKGLSRSEQSGMLVEPGAFAVWRPILYYVFLVVGTAWVAVENSVTRQLPPHLRPSVGNENSSSL